MTFNMVAAAFWTILSSSTGIPIGRFFPPSLSIRIRFTGDATQLSSPQPFIQIIEVLVKIFGILFCRNLVYSCRFVFLNFPKGLFQ